MPLRDEWRERVLELHAEGLNRRQITAQVPISSAYVSQIVAEVGRTFPGTDQVAPATRIVKQEERRLAEAEVVVDMMARALDVGQRDVAAGASAALSKLAL